MTTPNKAQHKHEFTRSNPTATVETCSCGKFRFTENAGPAIVEQRAQHTPGPWKAQGSQIIQADKMEAWQLVVASIPSCVDPKPKADAAAHNIAERDANARLIAAAPELLQALKAFQQGPPDSDNPDSWFAQYSLNLEWARAAIAKAERSAR